MEAGWANVGWVSLELADVGLASVELETETVQQVVRVRRYLKL